MRYKNIRSMAVVFLAGAMMAAGTLTAMAAQTTQTVGGDSFRPRVSQTGDHGISRTGDGDISRTGENPGPGANAKTDPAAGTGDVAGAGDMSGAGAAVVDGVIQPQNLEGAQGADQLIVVVGTGGCNADVYYYKNTGETWEMAWKEAGIVGKNGITHEKSEGDKSTPAGTYGFTMAFGLKPDPGSLLTYHRIAKGDYWVDDSASPYYNQLVNTAQTPKTWKSAENMAAASPYYNYALALDYNRECVPGKGSAIFLHCFTASADNGSAGCIRLPQERAKELVQSVTGQSKIIIAPELGQLK